jgi:hypothetical protein
MKTETRFVELMYASYEDSVMAQRELYHWCKHISHVVSIHSMDLSLMDREHQDNVHFNRFIHKSDCEK